MSETEKILLDLNFSIISKGFKYWIDAIDIYNKIENKYGHTIEQIYEALAIKYNSNRSNIERAMRTARKSAESRIKEKYQYNTKLTNKKILILITSYERR